MEKIHCPFHAEKTESCVIYETNYHCYGCGAHGPLSDIGLTSTAKPKEPKYVENLKEKLAYIASLPTKPIRGFQLPYDDSGYYLVWGGGDYYKLRVWDPNSKDKYRGAAGHPKPVFWARRNGQEHFLISARRS